MNTESQRIADQLHRAFEGQAWHGPSLRELLTGILAQNAAAHPLAEKHSIWEIVLHIKAWEKVGLDALHGIPVPKSTQSIPVEQDWPSIGDMSARAWEEAMSQLFRTNQQLCQAIEELGDDRLNEIVPGRKYNFYYLFHGLVQHSLYHAGQIALLKTLSQKQA